MLAAFSTEQQQIAALGRAETELSFRWRRECAIAGARMHDCFGCADARRAVVAFHRFSLGAGAVRSLGYLACCVVLAGCARGAAGTVPAPVEQNGGAVSSTQLFAAEGTALAPLGAGARFKLLYTFKGAPDGAIPVSPLLNIDGTFYGTTQSGGTSGWGTFFKVTKSGKETVLYSFKGPAAKDGGQPCGQLVNINGTLYGTTFAGGDSNNGTVFKITLGGTESILHSFEDDPDGAEPMSGLIDVGGTLFGTTGGGGTSGTDGTV
jgi:uncharacterized repeat protein (TIGR03803 family)